MHRNSRYQSRLVLRRTRKAGQHAGIDGTRRHDVRADPRFDGLQRHRLGDAFDSVLAADVAGNLRCLVKVHRAVERYWHRMLRSRSWAGRALNWSMFNQINERTPLLRPKLRLHYPELQALAVL